MIIRTAYQDTSLSHTHITAPAGNPSYLHGSSWSLPGTHSHVPYICQLHPCPFCCRGKIRNARILPIRAAQLMKVIINPYDLIRSVRSPGLLSISECGICDPDIIRHMMGNHPVIKCDLRYFSNKGKDSGTRLVFPHPPADTYAPLTRSRFVCRFIVTRLFSIISSSMNTNSIHTL